MKTKVFFFVICLLVTSIKVTAQEFEVDGFKYDLRSAQDMEVVLTGCKNIPEDGKLTLPTSVEYRGKTFTVTMLGTKALLGKSELIEVIIPDSYNFLQANAFDGCVNLRNVVLSDSITTMDVSCFQNCTQLEKIKLPSKLNYLGQNCFSSCTSLKEIEWGDSLKVIHSSIFVNCQSLENIEFPEGLTEIGSYSFRYCTSLKKVVLPRSLKSLGDYAFQYDKALETIISKSGTPPNYTRSDILNDEIDYVFATLRIPVGSKKFYLAEAPWAKFINIVEDEDLGEVFTVSYTIEGKKTSYGSNVHFFGDEITISLKPETGYGFRKLYVNDEDVTNQVKDQKFTFIVTKDIDYRIVYEPMVEVSVSQVGEGGYVELNGEVLNGRYKVKLMRSDSLIIVAHVTKPYYEYSLYTNNGCTQTTLNDSTFIVSRFIRESTVEITFEKPVFNCTISREYSSYGKIETDYCDLGSYTTKKIEIPVFDTIPFNIVCNDGYGYKVYLDGAVIKEGYESDTLLYVQPYRETSLKFEFWAITTLNINVSEGGYVLLDDTIPISGHQKFTWLGTHKANLKAFADEGYWLKEIKQDGTLLSGIDPEDFLVYATKNGSFIEVSFSNIIVTHKLTINLSGWGSYYTYVEEGKSFIYEFTKEVFDRTENIKFNGTPVLSDVVNRRYETPAIFEDAILDVLCSALPVNYYNISVNINNWASFTQQVKEGDSFTYSFTTETLEKIEELKYNGKSVKNEIHDGVYTSPAVSADASLVVTFREDSIEAPFIEVEGSTVTITSNQKDGIIYYTLDGSDPTSSSFMYEGPFTPEESCEVKAVVIKQSEVSTASVIGTSASFADDRVVRQRYYNTEGVEVDNPNSGVSITVAEYESGRMVSKKIFKK